MNVRLITVADVDQLFDVRMSVRENAVTRDQLARMGVTPQATCSAMDAGELSGYLCEASGRVVGFSMANIRTREIAVIAVRPEFEGRGIGRELLRLAEELLWKAGVDSIWLWTWPDRATRAVHLYEKSGWTERETKDGRLYMSKQPPNHARDPARMSGHSAAEQPRGAAARAAPF